MAKRKSRRVRLPSFDFDSYFGPQFDERRTRETNGDPNILRWGFVRLAMLPGTTPRDHILEMAKAASLPFQIKALSKDLEVQRSIRGRCYFGHTGKVIEKIMQNYPALRWWLGRGGLVIVEASNKMNDLSHFDRMAGALIENRWRNGHLSKESLVEIAKKLDNEGFKLKEYLQPAQWKFIADYNRKKPPEPIRTFSNAAGHPRFVRGVRRRLYLARVRYSRASRGSKSLPDQF